MEAGVGSETGVESGCIGCVVDVEAYLLECLERLRWRVGWNALRLGMTVAGLIVFFEQYYRFVGVNVEACVEKRERR